ncbi:hypothetical protein [Psychrobacter aestuarii]|uniref:Lipoprotein n=1 Tax=Psychrobacter aestuarii TaxID=556327 RepID=A0ABN0VXR0_9GAMM|nr:hypothetical protein [Psychrobacter aestuarii]
MSAVNHQWKKWQQIAGITVVCGLAVAGCNRSEDKAEETAEEAPVVVEEPQTPLIQCNDPMLEDRLKGALENGLNQEAQRILADYAERADISIDSAALSTKSNRVMIDINNANILPDASDGTMTTCQASVSMTLSSEDLYQASTFGAANNQPSLPSRLAEQNIRINNNMLIDDAFTYVVGMQGGQLQMRIAGRPAIIDSVSEVLASAVVKERIDEINAERAAAAATRRNEQRANEIQRTPKPPRVEPMQPTQPAPAPEPSSNSGSTSSSSSSSANSSAASQPTESKPANQSGLNQVPTDKQTEMVITYDNEATY